MRLPIAILGTLLVSSRVAQVDSESSTCDAVTQVHPPPPFVEPQTLSNGVWASGKALSSKMTVKDVYGCCTSTAAEDGACDADMTKQTLTPAIIGKMPQFTTEDTLEVLEHAKQAWNGGMGDWPQLSLRQRIKAIEAFLSELASKRSEIVNVLMWEIGKNRPDAESEFDRTISFVKQLIDTIQTHEEFSAEWKSIGVVRAVIRRAAVGIMLCLGPYNYPLNETYATLLPALLMGNVVILKMPTVGGLSHLLTMEAFSKALPPGVINFVGGSGRSTMPPMMKSGVIDGLAFIGGSAAADSLMKDHPHPHRLKIFLQLEAKNMAIYLDDLFADTSDENVVLEHAIKETVSGALSFNGQRCTALKMILIPRQHALLVAEKIATKVERMRVGLPWQTFDSDDNTSYSQITPLPNQSRVEYMRKLIDDAVSKGARILNAEGGSIIGGEASTLMVPAVIYPVTKDMDLYYEEQFGPIVPIVAYDDISEVMQYARDGIFAQQCSIFTADSSNSSDASKLVDAFSSIFGKININASCGRSPDTLPFSGRRSSAMGVMSVLDALKEFSIPTVISYKDNDGKVSARVAAELESSSQFMQPIV